MRAGIRVIIFLLVGVLGCDSGHVSRQGSWDQFSGGGTLNIGMPAVSEARKVYFVTSASGNGDIYVADTKTGATDRLTSSNDFEGHPVLSLDGQSLYFAREQPGHSAVFSIDVNSKRESRVTRGSGVESPVAELANGSLLLIRRVTSGRFGGHGLTAQYLLVDLRDQLRPARLIGDMAVANNVGTFILVRHDNSLSVVDANAPKSRTRLSIPFDALPLAISESGAKIVVYRQIETTHWRPDGDLYYMNIETGEMLRIGMGHSVAMNGSGDTILYSVGYGEQLRMYSVADQSASVVSNTRAVRSCPLTLISGDVAAFASLTDHRGRAYDVMLLSFRDGTCSPLYSVDESRSRGGGDGRAHGGSR